MDSTPPHKIGKIGLEGGQPFRFSPVRSEFLCRGRLSNRRIRLKGSFRAWQWGFRDVRCLGLNSTLARRVHPGYPMVAGIGNDDTEPIPRLSF